MNTKTLKKIETKTDGQNAERFGDLLKKVVNVRKKDIQEQEQNAKAKKAKIS